MRIAKNCVWVCYWNNQKCILFHIKNHEITYHPKYNGRRYLCKHPHLFFQTQCSVSVITWLMQRQGAYIALELCLAIGLTCLLFWLLNLWTHFSENFRKSIDRFLRFSTLHTVWPKLPKNCIQFICSFHEVWQMHKTARKVHKNYMESAPYKKKGTSILETYIQISEDFFDYFQHLSRLSEINILSIWDLWPNKGSRAIYALWTWVQVVTFSHFPKCFYWWNV